jgi:NAD(P)-dependent dehydrogenase (short-subunit alcohol dehydrogenase family)
VHLDVTDPASCAAAVGVALERHGRLDVLANVAGILQSRPVDELSVELWRSIIEVNLTGTFLLSQAALPPLLDGGGVIVNMASASGLRATPYNTAYCASKGGVIMLTKSMAIELAKRGVRVVAVCPGGVDTPLLRDYQVHENADPTLLGRGASPLGRLLEPAEIASAVAYLASDEAAAITGTCLSVDGGATA